MDSALEINTVQELERFDLGTVILNGTTYNVLSGYEGTGRCFWCGGELKGKLQRYCYGHMKEYYRHFDWGYASSWALKRVGWRCQNCGVAEIISKTEPWHTYETTNLRVHHIVPLNGESRQFTAYNLPWNLIVLCHDCHMEVHAIMRPPKNTPTPDTWEEAIKRGQCIMSLEMSSTSG